jgi:hypothetical protein
VEEVELVLEEMRRTRRYFIWRAQWWRERECVGCSGALGVVIDGRVAYAVKQAKIIERLSVKFVGLWHHELQRQGFPPSEIDI